MEIENYVMENIIKKIVCSNDRGEQYIQEEDINKFDLTTDEKEFIIQILPKYDIGYIKSYASIKGSAFARERFKIESEQCLKRMQTDPKFRIQILSENAERERYAKQLVMQNNKLWR